jgi:hypothetical protein
VECELDDLCELKQECVAAYRVHLRAVAGTRAARREVEQDAGQNLKAAELLGESAKALEEAMEKTKRCAEKEGAVVREYRLR